jgi:branched-subunit amino acid transport protein AzlD
MKRWLTLCLLLVLPSAALAAEPLDWKTHGISALVIAVVVSLALVWRNKSLTSSTAKILMFGLYFWVTVFAEAILYGAYYGLLR